jgi:hypothetical protein
VICRRSCLRRCCHASSGSIVAAPLLPLLLGEELLLASDLGLLPLLLGGLLLGILQTTQTRAANKNQLSEPLAKTGINSGYEYDNTVNSNKECRRLFWVDDIPAGILGDVRGERVDLLRTRIVIAVLVERSTPEQVLAQLLHVEMARLLPDLLVRVLVRLVVVMGSFFFLFVDFAFAPDLSCS